MSDHHELDENAVLEYLGKHPDFFEKHPDILPRVNQMNVVAFEKARTEQLQDKIRETNKRLLALVEAGQENQALIEKMHRMVLDMLMAADLVSMYKTFVSGLQREFNAGHVALLLRESGISQVEVHGLLFVSLAKQETGLKWLVDRQTAFCGRLPKEKMVGLFADYAGEVASVAAVPLHGDIGYLAIGSRDENHFHPDMATDYLQFLAEVLQRLMQLWQRK